MSTGASGTADDYQTFSYGNNGSGYVGIHGQGNVTGYIYWTN